MSDATHEEKFNKLIQVTEKVNPDDFEDIVKDTLLRFPRFQKFSN
jgi:phosphoenolpyruvate carboxylase